jgi:hypothetical protein
VFFLKCALARHYETKQHKEGGNLKTNHRHAGLGGVLSTSSEQVSLPTVNIAEDLEPMILLPHSSGMHTDIKSFCYRLQKSHVL